MTITIGSIKEVFFNPNEPEKFILDTYDFKALQNYLVAAQHLPSNSKEFQGRFHESSFDEFFPDDKPLYPLLRSYMIDIHTHCSDFRTAVIPAIMTLAGSIGSFADDANEQYTTLDGHLKIISAPGSSLADDNVKKALRRAIHTLDQLIEHAEEIKKECLRLGNELTNFQTQTTSDKGNLAIAHERFSKVIPAGKHIMEISNNLTAALRTAQTNAKASWENAEAYSKSTDVGWWYFFIGPKSNEKLLVTHPRAVASAKELRKVYDDATAAVGKKANTLLECQVDMGQLSEAFQDVERTIEGAKETIKKIMTFCSVMGTRFNDIKRVLGRVKGNATLDMQEDRNDLIWPEFEKGPKLWNAVSVVAKRFQLNAVDFATEK